MNLFGNAQQTLIVVYKDEMLLNFVKKLAETKQKSGDDESKNGVKIVSWTEKVWLTQKKQGNLESKVLFLGDIKGTDKLIPVLDIQYDEYGVKYGWAGKQAVLFADTKAIKKQEEYEEFLTILRTMPVPEIIKGIEKPKKKVAVKEVEAVEKAASDEAQTDEKKSGFLAKAKAAIGDGSEKVGDAFCKARANASVIAQEIFVVKNAMRRQMLFFGAVKLHENGLDNFLNS